MPIATALDEFRLLLGDRDTIAQLFNDVEAQWFIDQRPGNVLLAAADAADALAAQFAREFDFDANGEKSFKRSQKSERYAAIAARLRTRALTEGNSDGTGGVPTYGFPAPHDWQTDLQGVTTSIDPVTDWPL